MARGSNFASNPRLRALWFTRLAASGQFNKKCLESKGACPKRYTKTSSQGLKSSGFGSVSKKDKNFGKMVSQAKSNYKSGIAQKKGEFDRSAATKAIGKQMQLEKSKSEAGEKIKKRAAIKTETTASGATKARIRGDKDIRATVNKTQSQKLLQQLRDERKKDNKKRAGNIERAKRVTELAKDNKSLIPTAQKAQKEALPTAKEKRKYGAMKTNIIKAKKKETAAKTSNMSEEDKQRKRDTDFARLTALNNKDKKQQQSKKFIKAEGKNRGVFNAKTMKFEKKSK